VALLIALAAALFDTRNLLTQVVNQALHVLCVFCELCRSRVHSSVYLVHLISPANCELFIGKF
jgi:hypothetical protein